MQHTPVIWNSRKCTGEVNENCMTAHRKVDQQLIVCENFVVSQRILCFKQYKIRGDHAETYPRGCSMIAIEKAQASLKDKLRRCIQK